MASESETQGLRCVLAAAQAEIKEGSEALEAHMLRSAELQTKLAALQASVEKYNDDWSRHGYNSYRIDLDDTACLDAAISAAVKPYREALEEIQWDAELGWAEDTGCGVCGGHNYGSNKGHDSDCKIGKLLAQTEGQ